VNEKRVKEGLNALTLNQALVDSAEIRATEIVIKREPPHTRPDGTLYLTAITVPGFCIELTSWGMARRTPASVVNGWANSESHNRNMMDAFFTEAGVACYIVNGIPYWVMHLLWS
jgi:uncharacterized protein YkwD